MGSEMCIRDRPIVVSAKNPEPRGRGLFPEIQNATITSIGRRSDSSRASCTKSSSAGKWGERAASEAARRLGKAANVSATEVVASVEA